jgi:hypothetical protein
MEFEEEFSDSFILELSDDNLVISPGRIDRKFSFDNYLITVFGKTRKTLCTASKEGGRYLCFRVF